MILQRDQFTSQPDEQRGDLVDLAGFPSSVLTACLLCVGVRYGRRYDGGPLSDSVADWWHCTRHPAHHHRWNWDDVVRMLDCEHRERLTINRSSCLALQALS